MKILLGTPITGILNDKSKKRCLEREKFICEFINVLRSQGHEVFCAIEIEKFGEKIAPGEICTQRDFEAMKKCDVYVAFPNDSYGCAVELGWASAFGKPIFLAINNAFGVKTPLYEGLGMIDTAQIKNYSSQLDFPQLDDKELMESLNEFLNNI
ncbi:nucleoside 2-deoxyribosyltransferase [Lactococcus lactis]|jgi:nucleoside 2-deoxyribosyltransferase|uniref:Nucleoside 2-deoxyribosyltransferase n=2 Tax=Lactococcus lactis TaxID=1358 RepID=A0A0B8QKD4_LACLL|nr:nucleoside 2-deoxyribosyltransferase [Lactococcus lactis]MDN6242376.1 nucleoside 2-deoxyribosyltransferase [Tetragenococcus koreensis]ARE20924.1 nucleoside 2-deoxyribosyltransferase [Lactococcus lactis subsp. lactis]KST89223.1 hypothetical protein ATCC19435_0245 [Lactococcus lactis subsp. lactis]KSU26549.1 hypothetical protein N42_1487 [Lactococcus lactis subsp. lactis]MBU3886378.1 nucleoside 2-deoxyribosyltransferase [Lactococcus lactis]